LDKQVFEYAGGIEQSDQVGLRRDAQENIRVGVAEVGVEENRVEPVTGKFDPQIQSEIGLADAPFSAGDD
jgi:hypothetical protein